MTKKRFIGSYAGFYDKYKENRFLWSEWEEIIRILNNLNEKSVERSKALSKLQKENNQLKKENEELKEFKKKYDELLFDYNNRACECEDLQNELTSERQYILYLKSVLEDNEIWYNDGDVE